MTAIVEGESTSARRPEEPIESADKRRWDRPRIIAREPLEAVASVCSTVGKQNPGTCPSGPLSS